MQSCSGWLAKALLVDADPSARGASMCSSGASLAIEAWCDSCLAGVSATLWTGMHATTRPMIAIPSLQARPITGATAEWRLARSHPNSPNPTAISRSTAPPPDDDADTENYPDE